MRKFQVCYKKSELMSSKFSARIRAFKQKTGTKSESKYVTPLISDLETLSYLTQELDNKLIVVLSDNWSTRLAPPSCTNYRMLLQLILLHKIYWTMKLAKALKTLKSNCYTLMLLRLKLCMLKFMFMKILSLTKSSVRIYICQFWWNV